MLSSAQKAEFRQLQDQLGLSESALSKHLTLLVDAGYVSQDRALRNSRNGLWLSLTPGGPVPTPPTYRRFSRSSPPTTRDPARLGSARSWLRVGHDQTPHMAATWRASVPQQPPSTVRFGKASSNGT